jgi:hypothetical protein
MSNNGQSSLNIDSVMIDTCTNSPTYGKWFVKKGIRIKFNVYPFTDILEINEKKRWNDIDPNLVLLKNKLMNLVNNNGNFTIQRESHNLDNHLFNKNFILNFDSDYVCFDSLFYSLVDSVSNIMLIRLINPPTHYYSIPPDIAVQPGSTIQQTMPNMTSTSLHKSMKSDYHKLGFQWNLHVMNLPMAWDITRGNRDIFLLM